MTLLGSHRWASLGVTDACMVTARPGPTNCGITKELRVRHKLAVNVKCHETTSGVKWRCINKIELNPM